MVIAHIWNNGYLKKGGVMGFHYNHTTLVGRLTKDPEIKTFVDVSKTSFCLAVDRDVYRDKKDVETDFITVIVWGRLAEIAHQYLRKGNPVLIEGRIQVRTYEKEGKKNWITEVVTERLQFLGSSTIMSDKKPRNGEQKKSKKSKELVAST
ncbi:single-stranded DNA-binding protein [Candidatus Marinamargulisbacteria bacterium SCGC AG-439-L15]|nr:single-stranded DNA-binding protein [Candidatus Marinamargulisbacteria bacterium SCGC AG-439-L15]